jgi:hypothetical protein
MHTSIPKRIIQTGKRGPQSVLARAVMSNVRLLNPEYEYLFFDDTAVEQFLREEFPQFVSLFNNFPFRIQKWDFFRYLAVYRYGGFYFDVDVLLASNLTPLLDHGCVFPFEGITFSHFLRRDLKMDWLIGNYAFGASPAHPFLKAVIDNCVRAQEDPGWVRRMMKGSPPLISDEYWVLNSTGPGLVSRTLAENPAIADTVTVLFPEDVCDQRDWNRFGEYGVHLMDSSWRASRTPVHAKLIECGRRFVRKRLLEKSRKLGKTRPHMPRLFANRTGELAT